MHAGTAVFVPFILTFLIPGIMGAFLVRRGKETDLLLFIVYAGIAGFALQIAITIMAGIASFIWLDPAVRIVIAAAIVISALFGTAFFVKKPGNATHIAVSSYDIAALIVTTLLGLLLYAQMAQLPMPYFNSGSDQYYWLAYAARAVYDFSAVFPLLLKDPINQTAFFLILSPYAAFLPKDFTTYQSFIALWQYGAYALTALTLIRLAYLTLPVRILGLLAPLAMYMFHWGNYYLISTGVVPQNTAIFFLIAGFILLHDRINTPLGIAFLIVFYLVHMPTLAIFILIVGTAKIATESARIVMRGIRNRQWTTNWHFFESIAFVPTFVVIIFYGLYGSGILHPYPSGLISYFDEYAKQLTLRDQPYAEKPQITLIWLAVISGALVPIYAYFDRNRRRLLIALGFGFFVPWAFLITPLVAYHAFYASWQSFRYYLVMYPSMSVLVLLAPAATLALIGRYISKRLAAATAIVLVIIAMPVMMKFTVEQQSKVILDMIVGRDHGIAFAKQMQYIKELVSLNAAIPEGPIVTVGPALVDPYLKWAFAPRPLYTTAFACSEQACLVYDIFAHKVTALSDIPHLGLGFVQKKIVGESDANAVFKKLFSERLETESYSVYYAPRKQ